MSERFIEFLVDLNGKSPKNLLDSIRRIRNASSGFRESWLLNDYVDAEGTSQEAFEHFDYLQNELLRQRDSHKNRIVTWPTSPFKMALDAHVGSFANSLSVGDINWFQALHEGAGGFPPGSITTSLTLEKALNKLKHRDILGINFCLPPSGGHIIYVYASAGMGQPASLSEIDMRTFCNACRDAALHV